MISAALRSRAVGLVRSALRSPPLSCPSGFVARRSLFIQTEETPNPASLKYIPGRVVYDSHLITRARDALKVTEDPDLQPPSSGSLWGPVDPPAPAPAAEAATTTEDLPPRQGYYVTPSDSASMRQSPLGRRLLKSSDSVKSVYLGYDFVTVTKSPEATWDSVSPVVFEQLMDHFASGDLAVSPDAPSSSASSSSSSSSPSSTSDFDDTEILPSDSEVVAMVKELLATRIRPSVQSDGGNIRFVSFDEQTGIVHVKLEGSCVGCPSSSVTLKNGVENMLKHYVMEVKGVHNVEEGEGECKHDGGHEGHGKEGKKKGTNWEPEDVIFEGGEGNEEERKKEAEYRKKLAAAGIPFSD